MDDGAAKATLHTYLRELRGAVQWKVEGLGEYDARRPMTPTGTNLLGLVKHLTEVEGYYLGDTFDRPFPEPLLWRDDDADDTADLWVTAEETRAEVLRRYRAATEHADATIEALDLDSAGRVPWWSHPDVTLHTMLVHVLAETARHAGHADIVREEVDGATGLREDNSNLPDEDAAWWGEHRARVEAAARAANDRQP